MGIEKGLITILPAWPRYLQFPYLLSITVQFYETFNWIGGKVQYKISLHYPIT